MTVRFREQSTLLALKVVEYLLLLTSLGSVRVTKNLRGEWPHSVPNQTSQADA